LVLWSDPDPELKYRINDWINFAEELKVPFPGIVLFDWDHGLWWDDPPEKEKLAT
jgi:hypothetical protein